MNNVNKTLYIPLYGKSYVSRRGLFLKDEKAEQIWAEEGFTLKGKAKSKWLAYYMGMRSAVFDSWLKEEIQQHPDSVVVHIGCGLDGRVNRVGAEQTANWYDVDFPAVIQERRKYYEETEAYHMVEADVREKNWIQALPKASHAILVLEGISMYLTFQEMEQLFQMICSYFEKSSILMDCYTEFAAKASKFKNPINTVGVTNVYGLDNPRHLEKATEIVFVKEHTITPDSMIEKLKGMEKFIFQKIYGGSFAKKLYRLYEYKR